jgi:hypothetical protein
MIPLWKDQSGRAANLTPDAVPDTIVLHIQIVLGLKAQGTAPG